MNKDIIGFQIIGDIPPDFEEVTEECGLVCMSSPHAGSDVDTNMGGSPTVAFYYEDGFVSYLPWNSVGAQCVFAVGKLGKVLGELWATLPWYVKFWWKILDILSHLRYNNTK